MRMIARRCRPALLAVSLALGGLIVDLPGASAATPPATPNPGTQPGSDHEAKLVAQVAGTILAGGTPGAAIAIVKPAPDGSGSVVTSYYFGEADKSTGRLVGPATQFEIASETKTFTAALLAQRIANGHATLATPVQDLLPVGVTAPTMGGHAITLRDLATHRSGLQDDPVNLNDGCPGGAPCPQALSLYDAALLWAGLGGAGALAFAPGTSWQYSDWGFGLLGSVLADAIQPGHTEPPFADAVASQLTGPLGLSGTELERPTADLAVPYAGGSPTNYWDNTAAMAGGGGLISTIDDMATWSSATLGHDDTALGRILHSMLDPVAPGPSGQSMQMGLAWQLYPANQQFGHPHAFKNGDSAGSASVTYLVPETGWGVTVLTNGNDGGATDGAGLRLMHELGAASPSSTTTTHAGKGPVVVPTFTG